ncbi:MAG: peptidoglycan-binding protein, partial [Vulcanococcus sp.]
MKPVHFLLTTAASTAALGAAGTVVAPSLADSKSGTLPISAPPAISADLIAAAETRPSTEKIWVKARQAITLKHLA